MDNKKILKIIIFSIFIFTSFCIAGYFLFEFGSTIINSVKMYSQISQSMMPQSELNEVLNNVKVSIIKCVINIVLISSLFLCNLAVGIYSIISAAIKQKTA